MENVRGEKVLLYMVLYPETVDIPKSMMWFSEWSKAAEFAAANNGVVLPPRSYSAERAAEIKEYAIGYGEWGG